MKKLFTALATLGLISVLFAACSGASSSPSGGNYTVHMTPMNFAPLSITISRGNTITLVNDLSASHLLANGSWMHGNPQAMHENGMPAMENMQMMGNESQMIGPFNTIGTYHFYCTVHPGMNLTVIVQ